MTVVVLLATAGFVLVGARMAGEVRPAVLGRIPPVPVLVGTIAALVLLVPWASSYSGFQAWQVLDALSDQGGAFAAAAEKVADGTAGRMGVVVVQTIAAPFTLAAVPCTAWAWFEHRRYPVLFGLALVTQLTMSVLVGRDYYMTSAVLLVLAAWVLSRVRRGIRPSWRTAAVATVVLVLFTLSFIARKITRQGAVQPLCAPGIAECTSTRPPTAWEALTTYVASYVSQSMEGLSRALSGTWSFGGGYRHSPALSGLLSEGGTSDATVITDQLAARGWSDTAYWSTAWSWMANDLPWVVVPLVVGLFAAALAVFWRRAVRDADWLSVTVFCQGWLTMFFMAQNNVLTSNGPAYLGFLALVVLFAVREVRRALARRGTGTELDPEPTSGPEAQK
ncbi:hypothetical protein [Cellulomonas humilata]|uniref:Oligosaccharide repeat unit polymerase n=1 Tax=Cellulomonas humilata TaxID=144055 RepID=A0ABU0EGK2_9CELL|nr:hypothetical protein [Cellulomonas humilata]MDQ0374228.1 hypothetical protein [Cellulomonas humilata]